MIFSALKKFALEREVKAYVKKRNKAFEAGDIDFFRRMSPKASDSVVEMGFHKARYECTAVSEGPRRESQKWLAERALTDMSGNPVHLGEPLPGAPDGAR